MQSILFIIIRSLVWLVRVLPPSWALGLGRLGGLIVYTFDRKHRRLVYQNLKYAFAAQYSLHEIWKLTQRFFSNLGANFIEFLRQPLLDPEKCKNIIAVEGLSHAHEAMKQGRGLVAMTMHFGNWEFATLAFSFAGYHQAVIFKPQESASAFNKVMIACRKDTYKHFQNIHLYEKGYGARKILKALQNNEVAALVVDQGGKSGIPVKFLGRNAHFSIGGLRLAKKMGSPMCLGVVIRQKGLKHKFRLIPFEWTQGGEKEDENLRLNLERVAKVFEEIIRENPEQYMWMYKIGKFDKSKNVMILDDSRIGHLRQSQAVSRCIEQEVHKCEAEVKSYVVPVKYRGKIARGMIILTCLIGKGLPMRLRLWVLKMGVSSESFEALSQMKADIVISSGSFAAPLNCLIAGEHDAKSIHLLRPSFLPWNKFDVLILPEHDRPKKADKHTNVVFTKGAPNLIDDEYLQQYEERLMQRYSHLKFRNKFKIGVLLGGDTKDYVFDEGQAKILAHQIKEVAEQLDANIVLTTSRRTSEKVENLLIRELKKYPRCPLLVIANRNNIPEAVGGILAVSDVLVVTGDSISMVSEAASSGKKTIVVPIKRRNDSAKDHKHNRFVDQLNAEGYILCTTMQMLKTSIFNLAKNKIYLRKLDDVKRLHDVIAKIL